MGFLGVLSTIGAGVFLGKELVSDAMIKQIPADTDINAMYTARHSSTGEFGEKKMSQKEFDRYVYSGYFSRENVKRRKEQGLKY